MKAVNIVKERSGVSTMQWDDTPEQRRQDIDTLGQMGITSLQVELTSRCNCSNSPGRKLFVSADGSVAGCVHAAIDLPRLGDGGLVERPATPYGNLYESSFAEILRTDAFMNDHEDVLNGRPPRFCLGCNWIHGL